MVAALAPKDDNGCQRIGYREFISALAGRRVIFDRQQLWECFKKFDVGGNGRIAYEDVQSVLSGGQTGRSHPGITVSEWEEIVDVEGGNGNDGKALKETNVAT